VAVGEAVDDIGETVAEAGTVCSARRISAHQIRTAETDHRRHRQAGQRKTQLHPLSPGNVLVAD